jgi:hypothetical protein
MTDLTETEIATRVYTAMCAAPSYVEFAAALLAADTRTERATLLDGADPTVRDAALQYIAEPEATREVNRRLDWVRADPRRIAALKHYYRANIADFISEHMYVTDPRRRAPGQSALVPFTLWPAQRRLVDFVLERIQRQEPGVLSKGRDVGASSVCMATLAALCIFEQDFSAGIISATEAKLDRFQDTIFAKLRGLLRWLPSEFRAGYDEAKTSMYPLIALDP